MLLQKTADKFEKDKSPSKIAHIDRLKKKMNLMY